MRKTKVNVRLSNRWAVLFEPYPIDVLLKHWSYSVPGYKFMRGKFGKWDGKIKMLKYNKVPSGLFRATRKEIEETENIEFVVERNLTRPRQNSAPERTILRSEGKWAFQNKCARRMARAVKHGGGLILNATGSGKTRVTALLASRVNTEICFIVDQLDLLEQARTGLAEALGEDIGMVGDRKFDLKRVTVATIQTLHRHRHDAIFLKWFEGIEIILIDEIHVQMNRQNFDVINIAKPLAVFGLTATLALTKKPVRIKAYSLAGPVLFEYPLMQGMEEGVLSRGIGYLLEFENSIKHMSEWDSREAYEKLIVENAERNYLITRLIRRAHALGYYVIVVVQRIKHLERLAARLEHRNIDHKVVAGTFRGEHIEVKQRLKTKDKFEKGSTRVILCNQVFKKGIDIKRLDLIINASALRSVNDVIQIFGRGVRTHAQKEGLIYIDIQDVDPNDKGRKQKNWLARAAKSRKRALKYAGIKLLQAHWSDDSTATQVIEAARLSLQQELSTHKAPASNQRPLLADPISNTHRSTHSSKHKKVRLT